MSFRAAAPTDVAQAVPLIYSSGPATFDYVFDAGAARDALGFLRFAYLQEGGEFGWRNHSVAEMAGEVVAAGAAFDGRAMLRFTLAGALQILKFYGPLRAWGVMVRGLRTESVIRPPRAHEHYLGHIGVRQDLRGRGIGQRFVRFLLESLEPNQHRYAALDVAVTNPRAQVLYERLGFVVQELRPSRVQNRLSRVPDHYRMSRPADV